MFHFPHNHQPPYTFRQRRPAITPARLPHSETLGSQPVYQLPEAYRRLQRPSSALHTKASTERPKTPTKNTPHKKVRGAQNNKNNKHHTQSMMLTIAETTPTHTKPHKGFRYARASDARNHYTIHNHHTNNPHTPNQTGLARADAVTGITSRNPTACWTPTTHKKGHDNNHDKHTTRHDTHCLVQSQTTPKNTASTQTQHRAVHNP